MTRFRGGLRVTDVPILQLDHLTGPRAGASEHVSLDSGGSGVVGRSPDALLHFDDDTRDMVSRMHALLWVAPARALPWHLLDLGSRHGLFVNGERVRCHVLVDGDRVRLGHDGPELIVRHAAT